MKIIVFLAAVLLYSCTKNEYVTPTYEDPDYTCQIETMNFDDGVEILRAETIDTFWISGIMPGVIGFPNDSTGECFDSLNSWQNNNYSCNGQFVAPQNGWYRFNFEIKMHFYSGSSANFFAKISGGSRLCYGDDTYHYFTDSINVFNTGYHFLNKDQVVFFDQNNYSSSYYIVPGSYFTVQLHN